MPQSQDSTFDQLVRLLHLANKNGLYDAAEWLQSELNRWSSSWSKHSGTDLKKCRGCSNSIPTTAPDTCAFCTRFGPPSVRGELPIKPTGLRRRRDYGDDKLGASEEFTPLEDPDQVKLGGRFLTVAECHKAFADKVSAAGGHYIWEANGDEAIIISPEHQIKCLPFEEAKPFWKTLFELEENIEDPTELQSAIDDYCSTFFTKTASHWGSRLLKRGSDSVELHNRIEKASTELAELWKKVKPAAQRGYAIEHHLTSAQQLLKQGIDLLASNTQLEAAEAAVTMAEDTIRKASQEIAHLKF